MPLTSTDRGVNALTQAISLKIPAHDESRGTLGNTEEDDKEPALIEWRLKDGDWRGLRHQKSEDMNNIPLQEMQVGFQRGETSSGSNQLITGGVVLNIGVTTRSASRGRMHRLGVTAI